MTVLVSVVVPTYRRPALLRRCLDALDAQDLERQDYAVVIADNVDAPDTRHCVADWARRAGTTVRYLAAAHGRGPAAARNAGWRAARGPIIAFTDDDCVPDPSWLRHGRDTFDATVDAV